MQKINVNEVFASINGEVNKWHQGSPSVFVRLQGCNLRCPYCDTLQAQSEEGGQQMTVVKLHSKIDQFGIKRVTITGGEPLLQKPVFLLIENLMAAGYQISIETNGSIRISSDWAYWHDICWIVDYKMDFPDQMRLGNLWGLNNEDWVKFVINSHDDFKQALALKKQFQDQGCEARFAFSPAGADPDFAKILVAWVIEDNSWDIVVNIQLHKIINVK